jgi:hypothetical protein
MTHAILILSVVVLLLVPNAVQAFLGGSVMPYLKPTASLFRRFSASVNNNAEKNMSLDELKAELDLRGVNYEDCVNKQQLVDKLIGSRTLGKADPSVLNSFNQMNEEVSVEDVGADFDSMAEKAMAKDGGLPGGLPPETLKALVADPEVRNMLSDPKLQEIMTAVMTGGPDGIKKYMSDPGKIETNTDLANQSHVLVVHSNELESYPDDLMSEGS